MVANALRFCLGNHSDPMLLHYPPYLAQGRHQHGQAKSVRSHASEIEAAPTLHSVGSSSMPQGPKNLRSNLREQRESPPTSPVFYDYSEAFEAPSQSASGYSQFFYEENISRAESKASTTAKSSLDEAAAELAAHDVEVLPSKSPMVTMDSPVVVRSKFKARSLPTKAYTTQGLDAQEDVKRFSTGSIKAFGTEKQVEKESLNEDNLPRLNPYQKSGMINDVKSDTEAQLRGQLSASNVSKSPVSQAYAESVSSATDSMCTADSNPSTGDMIKDREPNDSSNVPSTNSKSYAIEDEDLEDAGSLRLVNFRVFLHVFESFRDIWHCL